MPDPQYQPLEFPTGGVNRGTEFELQPDGTTPLGRNVRAAEPATLRARGGSRAGTSKWVGATPGGMASPVQCLEVVVTASGDALLGALENDNGVSGLPPGNVSDGVPDPSTNNAAGGSTDPADPDVRNPGRTVPPGGSGAQPNRHQPGPGEGGGSSAGWVFVQKKSGSHAFSVGATRTDTLTFDSDTTKDQLLLVLVATSGDTDGTSLFDTTFNVTDSLGNTYAQAVLEAFTSESPPYSGGRDIVAAFWVRNAAGGPCTVSIGQTVGTPSSPVVPGSTFYALEYSGLLTSTPADGSASDSALRPGDGTMLTGTIDPGACPVTGSTRLVVMFTSAATANPTYTAPAGYTTRQTQGVLPTILEKLSSASAEHPTLAFDETALPFDSWNFLSLVVGFRYH